MRWSFMPMAICCVAALTCHAQTSPVITIRVIDTSSGKPMAHRGIFVYRINPDTHMPIVEPGLPLKGDTDADGRVSFSSTRLNSSSSVDAARKRLSKFRDILIMYAAGGKQCSTGLFSLKEILATGVVGDDHCNKKFYPAKFHVIPGEATIFVGKYHWWEAGQT